MSKRFFPGNDVEVSHSEYVATTTTTTTTTTTSKRAYMRRPFSHYASNPLNSRLVKKIPKRLGKIFPKKPHKEKYTEVRDDLSNVAVFPDNATLNSAEGQQSTARTIHSLKTEKVSNRQGPEGANTNDKPKNQEEELKKRKKSWKKLKWLVGVKDKDKSSKAFKASRIQHDEKVYLDVAIRGRLDGIDSMSLGPAHRSSLPTTEPMLTLTKHHSTLKYREDATRPSPLNFDPLQLSFTTISHSHKPSDIVSDLLWTSRGMGQTEIIFEGYASDRWTLRFDQESIVPTSPLNQSSLKFFPTVDSNDANDCDYPLKQLCHKVWGQETLLKVQETPEEQKYDDDLLEIAAACSVPVDLDEGTFIIDSLEHLQSVHDLVVIPLQARRFDKALKIFDKLLKGLGQESDSDLEIVVQSSTYHNIGIIQMCLGNFEMALEAFQKALKLRISFFSKNHPDVAVSLVRQGEAQFALGLLTDALYSFEQALKIISQEDISRAKILNNIGVVYYQCENHDKALESFVSALEIQRKWLNSSVKRQPIIYDASITLGNMGKLYLQKSEYKLSYTAFQEGYRLQSTAFPKESDLILATLKSMGLVLAKDNQITEALSIFERILKICEERFGSESEAYIETLGTVGCLLAQNLEFVQSSECLSKVLSWQKANLPLTSSKLTMTQAIVERVIDSADESFSIWV